VATAIELIEAYLDIHPHATDSLKGVRDWWLTSAARTISVDVLQAAVAALCHAQKLTSRRIAGGEVIYGRASSGKLAFSDHAPVANAVFAPPEQPGGVHDSGGQPRIFTWNNRPPAGSSRNRGRRGSNRRRRYE
jgi:hypothetical protein